ncbi:MAG: phospho-N-acetylmuramoyl-pentapeptide-transferase [Mangrovibacterium sp.]
MIYYLYEILKDSGIPGIGMFQYISFRAGLAVIVSLIITMLFGKRLIRFLQVQQIGEEVRNLGLEGQMAKRGTPTMGGVLILAAIIIPTLLFANLKNIYIILMLITTVWLGAIGFLDDYIKVFRKNKEGLAGKFKIIGQVSLGLIVAGTLYFSPDVVVREKVKDADGNLMRTVVVEDYSGRQNVHYLTDDVKSTKTTIPFVKNHEFDYKVLVSWFTDSKWAQWAIYIIAIILIITAVSNAANLTDGIDGLAAGTSAISGITLGLLAYVSGNVVFADYLNIMYIPLVGELFVFIAAFAGATIGFLWWNSYPAQIFMGDTGSLALGGILAVFAVIIRKELLIPLLCGIFLVENLSVMLQVGYFKYTKKKYGEGRRIILMSPIHHHYQKKGIPEPKIVSRFYIVAIILAVLTLATLKMR